MANAETGVNVGTTLLASQYKSPPFVCIYETGQGYLQDGDIAGTLRAEGENRPSRPSNIVCQYGNVAETLTSRHDSSPCADRGMNIVYENRAQESLAVRRLTPVECERLMGFPDNWTRIPWRGKQEEQCPDGPRYKACGNSMAVNCMRWIGMRIEYVERRMNSKARGEE